MPRSCFSVLSLLLGLALAPGPADAANITLQGSIPRDDTVQLFDVTVAAPDTSDTAGQCRTGAFTLDFVNVASATARGATPVPEPASLALLGVGLAGLGALPMARSGPARKRTRHPGAEPAQRPRDPAVLP